jgi:hypothetical protein
VKYDLSSILSVWWWWFRYSIAIPQLDNDNACHNNPLGRVFLGQCSFLHPGCLHVPQNGRSTLAVSPELGGCRESSLTGRAEWQLIGGNSVHTKIAPDVCLRENVSPIVRNRVAEPASTFARIHNFPPGARKILRAEPKAVNFLEPAICWLMAILIQLALGMK